nr:hypothetical protein BaRGS_010811 [Batillaria attramentaria]
MIVSVQVNEYYNNGATSSHPGFWEIPVNSLFNKESGFPCVYVDACRPPTQAEAVDYLWSNFENTYNGNRAPFGLHMHAAWFFTEDYLTAMQTFIDRLLALDDVYIVSAKQRTNCLNLNTTGIEYDSSLVTSHKQSFTWPFTLDYGCKHTDSAQCPQGGYPGLWEVPIVPLIDYKQQFSCTYADACLNHPPTSQDTFTYLMHNFNQALTSSRAPMGINLRREWFSHSHYWPNVHGLSMFLDTVLNTRNDVYVVSIERMLDWMRNPVGLDQIKSFQRWNC